MREPQLVPLGSLLIGIDAGHSPDVEDTPAGSGEWGVLKVSAVGADGFHSQENKVVREQWLHNPALRVRTGDLLITRANTAQLVGLACIAGEASAELMLSDKTLRLRVDKRVAPARYIQAALGSSIVRRQIENLATGTSGSMKNISQRSIRNLMIPFSGTEDAEQTAEILDSADSSVAAAQEAIKKTRLQKLALINELVMRYEHGSVQTLRECAILVSGRHIPTELVGNVSAGVPYLTGPADFRDSIAVATKFTKFPQVICKDGDILITVKGSGCGKVARAAQRSCISRQLMAVQFKTSGDEDQFWFEWMAARGELLGESSASGLIPGISREQILSLAIPSISQDRRRTLGRMFRALDEQIVTEEKRVNKLSVVKQGLLTALLTGGVQVPALYRGMKPAVGGDVVGRGEGLVEVVVEFFRVAVRLDHPHACSRPPALLEMSDSACIVENAICCQMHRSLRQV